MTWMKVLWAVVAPKRNGLWSSDLRWIKVERRMIPVMCICGALILELQSFESWQNLGNVKIGFNLGAHNFRSDYAIMTELAPKWNPFHVHCDDLHIVGDAPKRLEVIQLWSWQNLRNVKIGFNLGAHNFRLDFAVMTELVPKWSPFHVLCDDLHIVGDTPYRLGVIQLWSLLYYERRKSG